MTPRISLINMPTLNYLLRSQIFVNDDEQLRAAHLILDYKPISRTFLDTGNSIRANDYRLAHIDVSRPHFLAHHNLPSVAHPILQGIPLAAQPLQQVPLGQEVEEGAISSSSLEVEINKFRFEEEETQVEAIVISEAEEEAGGYLSDQTLAPIITYMEDSSDNNEEEMAPKPSPSLKELMKARNKGPFPQEANKSKPPVNPPPPPPRLSADLTLKPLTELKRKRHQDAPEEGEVGPPKGSKQQKQSQDQRSRRSDSIDSREELPVAQVRHPTHIWSPKLEVDGVPIA